MSCESSPSLCINQLNKPAFRGEFGATSLKLAGMILAVAACSRLVGVSRSGCRLLISRAYRPQLASPLWQMLGTGIPSKIGMKMGLHEGNWERFGRHRQEEVEGQLPPGIPGPLHLLYSGTTLFCCSSNHKNPGCYSSLLPFEAQAYSSHHITLLCILRC